MSAEEASEEVMSWPSVARCAPDENPSDEWACDHSAEFRRHLHDGTVGQDLQPAAAAFAQLSYRPPIKCKDPVFGNPISCDTDDITVVNQARTKDIWNMTPIKVVVGGPTMSNEPPQEPVDEVTPVTIAAGKGGAKAQPDIRTE